MPLRRTPPKKSCESLSDSEPNSMKSTPHKHLASTLPARFKRKYPHGEDMSQLSAEIKQSLNEFMVSQDMKYSTLLSSVTEIKEKCAEVCKTIDFISIAYDEIMEKLKKLEAANKEKLGYIQILEKRIDDLEMSNKTSSIEIRNLPLLQKENKTVLSDTVIKTSQILQVELQRSDIHDVYRVHNKTSSVNSVVVEMASVLTKENLLSAYKAYIKNHNRLSTTDLQCEGPVKLIYMSESLTAKKRHLFYLTRVYARTNEYAFCWITNGKILLRKKEGEPAILISSESDLRKLNTKRA